MKDKDETINMIVGALVVVSIPFVVFLSLILGPGVDAVIVSYGWEWFGKPHYDFQIGVGQAFGPMIVIRLLTQKYRSPKKESVEWWAPFAWAGMRLAALAIAGLFA